MSKIIEIDRKTMLNIVTLEDSAKCGRMYNGVCCFDASKYVTETPAPDQCSSCRYFRKEELTEGDRRITSVYHSLFE